ncbi:hypothetical protein OHA48_01820 [Streptomyces sp. NBC_00114]|uniref:hypothetical protein n=1 Tax=Streptomyces sp. NBC_00114 TaxID=2975656 RepID=UPI00325181B0|nr:hypothetical protein [Streptomyces sp. NBC_00078]
MAGAVAALGLVLGLLAAQRQLLAVAVVLPLPCPSSSAWPSCTNGSPGGRRPGYWAPRPPPSC